MAELARIKKERAVEKAQRDAAEAEERVSFVFLYSVFFAGLYLFFIVAFFLSWFRPCF